VNRTSIESDNRVLSALRGDIPLRGCGFGEALRIAELQANHLLNLARVAAAPVSSQIVSRLPRIEVHYRDLPTSGLAYWNGRVWIIGLNRREPVTRQRFTLFHEYKHIIDHGSTDRLYPGSKRYSHEQQAEQAADYFAGCVLMPRLLMQRAWNSGLRTPDQLARHFRTSERAIQVRLTQVGLVDEPPRCYPLSLSDRPATLPFTEVTA
jgi:Zn-dependent peptidase ImmA (M78 family)